MGILNGIATALAMATFLGIAAWAFSRGRREANREAAHLPFDLPDESTACAAGQARDAGGRS